MKLHLAGLLFGAQLWLVGCSDEAAPRAEWLISVSTDAPVPQLGDRLLIETVDETGQLACDSCRRVLSASSAEDLPVSFSVVPNGRRLLLRSRLYRARITGGDGLPSSEALIDQAAFLPETTTRIALTVRLSLDCFGVPVDFSRGRSCSNETGLPRPFEELTSGVDFEPGSSTLARADDCGGDAPSGMRCIAGGLFLRGDEVALSIATETNARPEHLVRLSPFFLDEDEATVGQVRQLIQAGAIDQAPARQGKMNEATGACTYLGATSAANDALPANCLRQSLAAQVCVALGKRLPTEAEWEYAAGNRGAETTFPWGADASICEHANVGRANLIFGADFLTDGTCLGVGAYEPLLAPAAGGHALDVTQQGVRNLAGNVSELVADAFGTYTGPCWGADRVLENPRCDVSDFPSFPVSLRGGAWDGNLAFAPAVARANVHEGATGGTGVGFRCAKDAE